MKKINRHIIIARTSIKRLSSMSKPSGDALATLLSKHYEKVTIHLVDSPEDLDSLVQKSPDLVFMGVIAVEVPVSENSNTQSVIWLTEYLDDNGIVYTGSGPSAAKLEHHKGLSKQHILDAGFDTSAYFSVEQNMPIIESEILLTFPMFVKPIDRGGGLGVDSFSVVHNYAQLESKVTSVTVNFGSDSLVEEYLDGREFSVAIMKDKTAQGYDAMPLELIAPEDEFGSRILSSSIKTDDTESFIAVDDGKLKDSISTLAINSFKALGARDYGRIDIRLDSKGVPQFLEANLIPSLLENYGNFPKACLVNKNMNHESVILRIVELALKRNLKAHNKIPHLTVSSRTHNKLLRELTPKALA